MKIRAAVLREPKKPLSIEEVELEDPKEGEVLIKYLYTGFCRSDLHQMLGEIPVPMPGVVGHETSGIVEAVGPGVTRVEKGDHVVAVWMIPCGKCPECLRGRGNICSGNFSAFREGTMLDGTTRLWDKDGNMLRHYNFTAGFASHMVMPEGGVVPVPKEFPLEQACFMSCCVPTGWGSVTNAANLQPGDSVAIFGIGGVGLNVLRAAVLRHGYPVIAVDIEGSKREIAMEFGATHFIDSSKEDPVPIIQEMTGGGANVVFEAMGDPGAEIQAYWSLGMGAKLILPGIPPFDTTTNFPLGFLPLQEKSIIGTLYGGISTDVDIPRLIQMASRNDLKLDKLITRRFKLKDINEVAEAMIKRKIIGRWVCELE